jgi:hypothetical protein
MKNNTSKHPHPQPNLSYAQINLSYAQINLSYANTNNGKRR